MPIEVFCLRGAQDVPYWRVAVDGRYTTPLFPSRADADKYAAELKAGATPEFPELKRDVRLGRKLAARWRHEDDEIEARKRVEAKKNDA